MPSALTTSAIQILNVAVTVLFALYIVMLPRYTDVAKTWYVLLILTGLVFLLANLKRLARTSIKERFWIGVVLLQFGWIAFTYYYSAPERGSSFLWGRHFYMLFLVPLFFLFREIRISDRLIIIFLSASALLSFADILLDLFRQIDHRAQGMNPNSFGPIQLCIAGILFFYFMKIPQKTLRRLAFAGFALALSNTVLSWSKTTLISMVVVGALFLIYFTRTQPAWKKIIALLILSIAIAAIYSIPIIKNRFDSGVANVTAYFDSDDYRDDRRLGSFGTRVELWKTAWHIFLENPLTGGIGVGGFQEMAQANSERYQVNDDVHNYKYAHNQYLVTLATRGVPGLVLFLLFIFYPIYIAASQRGSDPGAAAARLALIYLCLVYIIGCVGEDHFESKPAIMFVSVFVALLLARISSRQPDQPQPDPA